MPIGQYERYPGLDDGLPEHIRRCSHCREAKPRDAFSPDRRASTGLQRICKACRKAREAAWREANPDEVTARARAQYLKFRERKDAYQRVWKAKNRDRVKGYAIKKRYGISQDELAEMRARQDGRCGICERPFTKTPHTDHDHATGRVRGLLCGGCNLGLGFYEKAGFLAAAAKYLRAHGARQTLPRSA